MPNEIASNIMPINKYHRSRTSSHGTALQCEICSALFRSGTALSMHRNKHLQRYKCPQCDCCLASAANLRHHLETHVPLSERTRLTCTLCLKTLSSNASLQEHLRRQHGIIKKKVPFYLQHGVP